jgi:carbon-monoxide dehydrogenase catalytic subunit
MSNKSIDPAVNYMLGKLEGTGVETVWDRQEQLKNKCGFGEAGSCCHNCFMGPCRISPTGKGAKCGVCGARAEVIVARNFGRMIAGGTAAHSDHGRDVASTLLVAATNPESGYTIKDVVKLKKIALFMDIPVDGRSKEDIAKDVALKSIGEFGRQDGEAIFIKRAPQARQDLWRKLDIVPRGIDREVVEMMHRTTMGVDHDYRNLMLHGARTALADGWSGSMIATELQDIMFGTPTPVRSKVNLGVLSKTEVNIVIHGHEPVLSEMVVQASRDPEMIALAKSKGAAGINLAGICCTANEILIRHGVPIAGNILQQELAIATGAVDAMVVDVQCIMPSLIDICKSYHTKLINTSSKGKIENAEQIILHEGNGYETAKEIVRTAILNFENRGEVDIPNESMDLVAGFSHEAITYMLGGKFRGSYVPLNDNIINGKIRGVVGVVGCNNPKVTHDKSHVGLVEELIANDILVVQTGCSAIACAKAGFLTPEASEKLAGKGLAEVCATVGMPPVLHSGSCVDNSRILTALSEMVRVGGLGKDISDLPVAGAAPEWMSEKAIAIGQYFVASGVYTVFGVGLPVTGSEKFCKLVFEEYEETFGGKWAVEPDSGKSAGMIIDHINKKREKLGIGKGKERVLFDMDMRRELEV